MSKIKLMTDSASDIPQELEKKHREILLDAEKRFAASISVNGLKEQIDEIKEKIDQIYNLFLTNNS